MLLDRSRGALVCCVPIDLRGAMHLEQVCCVWRSRASETKHERKSWLCIGSLACGKATGS